MSRVQGFQDAREIDNLSIYIVRAVGSDDLDRALILLGEMKDIAKRYKNSSVYEDLKDCIDTHEKEINKFILKKEELEKLEKEELNNGRTI